MENPGREQQSVRLAIIQGEDNQAANALRLHLTKAYMNT